ncbi:MAG: hypothetical protein SGJ10_03650 [Bacteroidota bacterium]|nr:hypothetical protein [Bacteroidota bacterium]
MSKKIIILALFISGSINLHAQDQITVQASKRAIGRFYSGIFKSIAGKTYNAISQNKITMYKDDKLQKTYTPDELKKVGQYNIKVTKDVYFEKEKKYKTCDTTEMVTFESAWLWGFKKVNPTLYAWYFKRPKDGEDKMQLWGYINGGQFNALLSEFEWKMIDDFTTGNKEVVTINTMFTNRWQKYKAFGPELYNAAISDRVAVWENYEFANKMLGNDVKLRFQMNRTIRIKQDPNIPDLDYDSVYQIPFLTDSLMGFGFIIKIVNDPNTGNVGTALFAMSSLFDPTGMGGEVAFVDEMFWIKKEDLEKILKPNDWKFINEIIYLAFSERLNCECFF